MFLRRRRKSSLENDRRKKELLEDTRESARNLYRKNEKEYKCT